MNVDVMMVILIFLAMVQFAKLAAKKLSFIVIKRLIEFANSVLISELKLNPWPSFSQYNLN